jgi:hypothetical protein
MISIKTFSTVPCKEEVFWQVVLFPTITILRSPDEADQYTVIGFEWLFWSLSILINDKTRVSRDKTDQSYYTNI